MTRQSSERRVLGDVVDLLACPYCGTELSLAEGSLRCRGRHVFDIARQGYVNLLPGHARTPRGDLPAMVEARAAWLARGHYAPIAREVGAAAQEADSALPAGCVVDVGAGTGYYLAGVLNHLCDRVGLALDASKHALRRAARAHKRMGAVVCDVWHRFPVRAEVAALALNVFAPRNGAEMQRVLKPNGVLLVVTPTPRHLVELVSALGLLSVDENKQGRLGHELEGHFTALQEGTHEFSMSLSHEDVEAVAAMGPSAWHVDRAAVRDRVRGLREPLAVTASVRLSVFRRL
jgi:23S rRNA (guanine745-N1)-methyltransferase